MRSWPGFTWVPLSYTEEEKAEAREFEEDQVAGRLKEDVVSVEGEGWEGRDGIGLLLGSHSSPFHAARAEGQAAEVSGKGGEWTGHFVTLEGITRVGGQKAQLGTQAVHSLLWNAVGTWPDRVSPCHLGFGFPSWQCGGKGWRVCVCGRGPSCPQSQ